ncbi:hypothetical protein UFOVP761_14 [uncultured Caudovirales phage]|uniref:Uncharacterized protein n=1 Tax=uncultured Caudovirales phage TaxID=2100421 RepID=A0A6J5NX56_9CAUD|nr:hypothetical protein UFOVP761_14 [uncultured Caudovirales phage]
MTTDTRYNGWTNYATWRVNLEVFDGATADDIMGNGPEGIDRDDDLTALALALSEHAELIIEEETTNASHGLARSFALSFLSDVNWGEIAEHMLSDWEEAHYGAYQEDAE